MAPPRTQRETGGDRNQGERDEPEGPEHFSNGRARTDPDALPVSRILADLGRRNSRR
jgi:hypothetical protein